MKAYEIREAVERGENHTKQQHSEAEGCDANEKLWWNYELPHAEQYTKQEYSAETSLEKLTWNYKLPHAEQYTKQEYNAETAEEKRLWNYYLPHAEQYTEAEIEGASK